MKLQNIALTGALAALLLTGCEMKEELWGGENTDNLPKGNVELAVAVKEPLSMKRAENTVNTDNYPVDFKGISEGLTGISRSYATLNDVPASITLPIGTYLFSSHTPGELEKQMTAPYYAGEKEVSVTSSITSEVVISCTMQNSRIKMVYGDDFKENFTTWTITIDDGSDKALTYTHENLNPAEIFWNFGEDLCETITVNIRATTSEGNTVNETQAFKKSNASASYGDVNGYFEGGDAVTIQMGAAKASNGDVTGITINTSITFSEYSQAVEIPVFDDVVKPITVDDNGTGYMTKGVTITETSVPSNVALAISTPEGLKSLKVSLNTNNSNFTDLLKYMAAGVTNVTGIELLTATQSIFPTKPTLGMENYNLDFTAFLDMAKTYIGTHTFTITITDNAEQTEFATLVVTTKEAEQEGGGEGGEDAPIITMPEDLVMTQSAAMTTTVVADAIIKAPKGIKSMVVKIVSGSTGFTEALEALLVREEQDGGPVDFINGEDLVGNDAVASVLAGVNKPTAMPTAGATEYTFPIGNFALFIAVTGSNTTPHEFHIELTDNDGNVANSVYKITLTD